jgi:hypothetical protein
MREVDDISADKRKLRRISAFGMSNVPVAFFSDRQFGDWTDLHGIHVLIVTRRYSYIMKYMKYSTMFF